MEEWGMSKNQVALMAVALSAVATISAVSQEDIDSLRSHVNLAELTQSYDLAAVTQRVEGSGELTRAFNAPSMELYEEHLVLLERELALEQEELRAVRLQEIASQEATELAAAAAVRRAQAQEVALTRQVQLNDLLQEQLDAEIALAAQTRDMLDRAGIQEDKEAPGLLGRLRNRIAALLS